MAWSDGDLIFMNTRLRHLSLGIWFLLTFNPEPSIAKGDATADDAGDGSTGEVVVVGKRASLVSAQEIKQDKLEIVDSLVADDINKLPDFNVTDALSRITGVQVLRDRGEGGGVSIRGLTQMETLLNGREVFTAGSGRNLNFADIPSEMLSGVDVYKTSSANHIEGGVGGMVDLRTHKPFDFKDRQIFGSARMIYGDLADDAKPQFSTLMSDRWQTEAFGEIGALLNFTYQQRAFREDQKSAGNPFAHNSIISGRTVIAPNGTTETSSLGQRDRIAGSAVLQWRPSDHLEFYAEGSYAEFKTIQNSYQINAIPYNARRPLPTFVAGSPRLFPGTNDLQSITWTNVPVSILSFARDTVDRTSQEAVGGIWNKGALTLKTDLSYTQSFNNLFFSGPVFGGSAPLFSQNLSASVPGTGTSGIDLLDPAYFQYASLAYRTMPFRGDLSAVKLDGEYTFSNNFIKSISAGIRYAKRGANNAPGLIFADKAVPGSPSAAVASDYVMSNPASDFLGGTGTNIGPFMVGNLDFVRNAVALRKAFGITEPIPVAGNPLSVWHIDEETQAAYLTSHFKAGKIPLDGNIGLRVVRTQESVTGSQTNPSIGPVLPIDINHTDLDYLPSLNLRYRFMDDLYFRVGASKSITRQDFNQLSPSLTLIPNTVTPALNRGGAGNPALKPVRSDNIDVSVEKYFDASTSIYATGFLKWVDGFLSTVSNPEVHDGLTYQVSRPQNGRAATIDGFEAGYQQFYDFLPGWLSGLGMQANYTYVDSETPSSILGKNTPLQNLSKHSYNLVGMYEKGPISARIAYNWRDTFMSSIDSFVGVGALPVYTRGYGWLDASLAYRIDKHFSFSLEGLNLLNTLRSSYFGTETRPQSVWVNDTQVGLTMAVKF